MSVIFIVNNRFKKLTLWVVKKKEHFMDKIKEMDVVVQEVLVKDIQQITENGANILAFQDVAECTIE